MDEAEASDKATLRAPLRRVYDRVTLVPLLFIFCPSPATASNCTPLRCLCRADFIRNNSLCPPSAQQSSQQHIRIS